MRARKLIFALFFLPMFTWAQEGSLNVKFEDLPRLVNEKNGNVAAARNSHLAAKERTGFLRRSFLPTISARTGTESARVGSERHSNMNYWTAEGKINLFRGGRDKLEENILSRKSEMAGHEANREIQSEIRDARSTYWHLAAVELLLKDAKEAIEKNEDNIKSARRRVGAGVATGADAVQFDLEKTELVYEFKKLELEQDVLRNRLAVIIGHADHKRLRIEAQFPHPPESEFQEIPIHPEENLSVSIFKHREEIERMRSRQAGRWYMPQVDVYASYGVPSMSEDHTLAIRQQTESIAGISLSLDLGHAFQDRAVEKAQELESKALASRGAFQKNSVRAQGHELQHDLRLLHELIHDADKNVQRAQEFLKLTRIEYARGAKNGPDLLEAFSKSYAFRRKKIELNLEYQLAKAELDALFAKGSENP